MISVKNIFSLSLIVFGFLSIFINRIYGSPVIYIGLYIPALVFFFLTVKNYKIIIPKFASKILLFFCIYFIYSLFISTDILSTIKYFTMWIFNVIVMMSIYNISDSDKIILNFLRVIAFFAIIGLLMFIINYSPISNPFLLFDRNGYIFILIISLALSIKKNYKLYSIIFFISGLFTFSRTFLLMSLVALLFYSYKKFKFYSILKFILLISFFGFLLVVSNPFLFNRLNNAIILISTFFEYFSSNAIELGANINDSRRFYVTIANLNLINFTFPFGTGMGNENYLNYLHMYSSDFLDHTDHLGRAHNFYISYLAEAGLLFFIFVYLLFKPLYLKTDIILKSFYFSLLIGIATNEYITSPFVWFFLGILYKNSLNYDKIKLKEL